MAQAEMMRIARAALDIFLPRECICCGGRIPHDRTVDICESCQREFARAGGRWCPKCAAAVPRFGSSCPNCHNLSIAMKGATAYGLYQGVLRERIIEYKFSGGRHLGRTLGALVAAAARTAWPDISFDAAVGVPLHRRRAGERGFDQAQTLASYAARTLGIPHHPRLLRRTRATESQVGLTKSARLKNVKGAFEARRCTGMETALLVDDIITTGATASEAARALKRAGVKRVYAAVIARAGFHDVPQRAQQRTDRGGDDEDQS